MITCFAFISCKIGSTSAIKCGGSQWAACGSIQTRISRAGGRRTLNKTHFHQRNRQ